MNEILWRLGSWLHFLRIQPSGKTLADLRRYFAEKFEQDLESMNLRILARIYDNRKTSYCT